MDGLLLKMDGKFLETTIAQHHSFAENVYVMFNKIKREQGFRSMPSGLPMVDWFNAGE